MNAQTGAWGRSAGFTVRWQGDVAAVAVNAAGDAALLWDTCWFDNSTENGCASLRVATRAAGKATWTATRFAADAYFATAGEGRALGIAADGSPTIVWAGDDEAIHAASPRAGGWAKRKVSGPDVYVVPSFDQGVALAVDEQGRAVAAWRGGPYLCDEPQSLEATVRGDGTAKWEATRRLATDEVATCEFSSNPPLCSSATRRWSPGVRT